ncbi:MAG: LPXTG cell wall anchor domain-containing protein [Clostridiales bacterium]
MNIKRFFFVSILVIAILSAFSLSAFACTDKTTKPDKPTCHTCKPDKPTCHTDKPDKPTCHTDKPTKTPCTTDETTKSPCPTDEVTESPSPTDEVTEPPVEETPEVVPTEEPSEEPTEEPTEEVAPEETITPVVSDESDSLPKTGESSSSLMLILGVSVIIIGISIFTILNRKKLFNKN